VPKSRVRRKATFTPPPTSGSRGKAPRRWVVPVMLGCFILGLTWIVVYYIWGTNLPLMNSIGAGNLLIGFGLLGAGFACATQWR